MNASLVARPTVGVKRRLAGTKGLTKRKAPANRGFADNLVRLSSADERDQRDESGQDDAGADGDVFHAVLNHFVSPVFVHCTINLCALHINRPSQPTSAQFDGQLCASRMRHFNFGP
jgi:hypothetical protein